MIISEAEFSPWTALLVAICPVAMFALVFLLFVRPPQESHARRKPVSHKRAVFHTKKSSSSSLLQAYLELDSIEDAEETTSPSCKPEKQQQHEVIGWQFPEKEDREARRLRWARALHQRLRRNPYVVEDERVHGKALFTPEQLIAELKQCSKRRGPGNPIQQQQQQQQQRDQESAWNALEDDKLRLRLLVSLLHSGPPHLLPAITEDTSATCTADATESVTSEIEFACYETPPHGDDAGDFSWAIDILGEALAESASQGEPAPGLRTMSSVALPRPYQPRHDSAERLRRVRSVNSPACVPPAAVVATVLEEKDPVISLARGYATRQVAWEAIALLSRQQQGLSRV